jgi:hypothetical protein
MDYLWRVIPCKSLQILVKCFSKQTATQLLHKNLFFCSKTYLQSYLSMRLMIRFNIVCDEIKIILLTL